MCAYELRPDVLIMKSITWASCPLLGKNSYVGSAAPPEYAGSTLG